MSLQLYMDHHVKSAITKGLRAKGVDVITALEDAHDRVPDPELLDRATALGRVLFSQDDDLLAEGVRRQRGGEHFGGIIYVHQHRLSIGECIDQLELIAQACDSHEMLDRIEYLPL